MIGKVWFAVGLAVLYGGALVLGVGIWGTVTMAFLGGPPSWLLQAVVVGFFAIMLGAVMVEAQDFFRRALGRRPLSWSDLRRAA